MSSYEESITNYINIYNDVIELFIKEDLITVMFAGNTTEINSTLENM